MNEPMTQTMVAIGVLVLLLCLRRRRTGTGEHRTSNAQHRTLKEEEEARVMDAAFLDYAPWRDSL